MSKLLHHNKENQEPYPIIFEKRPREQSIQKESIAKHFKKQGAEQLSHTNSLLS